MEVFYETKYCEVFHTKSGRSCKNVMFGSVQQEMYILTSAADTQLAQAVNNSDAVITSVKCVSDLLSQCLFVVVVVVVVVVCVCVI
jgi:hypothetical protein